MTEEFPDLITEFQHFNYDLTDFSWAEKLPGVTVECSEVTAEHPKVSVIIANYNNAPYLERMMQSLLEQTLGLENLQILFVDDRSTDDSLEKVRPFLKKYPNIELYLLNKNTGGAHGPRNVGLLHARGDYLVILDADDWYAKDGLEALYQALEASGDGIAFGGVARSKNGQLELMARAYNAQAAANRPISELPYDFYTWLGPQGNMIRHSLVKSHNLHFIDQRVADDVSFFYQALLISQTISQVPTITTYVNRDDDNVSLSKNINETFLESWLRAISYMLKNYPAREDLQKFVTRRLEWLLVDFTLRWDTKYGLNLQSIRKLRSLMSYYLGDLSFDPSQYFTLDVYGFIWQYLQAGDDEKLLSFVAWHTLAPIDKSLQKIDGLYYFIPEDNELPRVNDPIIKGKAVQVDETAIHLQFDYYIPEKLAYVELRSNTELNHVLRKSVTHLTGATYELTITRTEFSTLASGRYKLYVVLENQLEYLIAIDQLQPYCGNGTLLSDADGVLNLYRPTADEQAVLAFKALPDKYLGRFIQVKSVLNEAGDFEFILPDGEKISQEHYQNSIIVFPPSYENLTEQEAFQAGIYRVSKKLLIYQEEETTALTIKIGTLLTASHIWFSADDEMILTTSAGSVKFDRSALEPVKSAVELVVLKNIYSYAKPDFDKNSKKKHYLKGATVEVLALAFAKDFSLRFLTKDGKYITEKPNFVTFTENLGQRKVEKTSIWQAIRQK